ncbi:MFS transporter [Parasphingorhabdus sp.]|uniref:MFS transporter n=1 Tax=Parasphingorhabdus sp. TaxID=2709688 RepID=UPI00326302E3
MTTVAPPIKPNETVAEVSSDSASWSPVRSWLVVAALSFAGIVSYIDRQIINLLVDPIKANLGLSDVQISLLQGFSFALLYAVMAIPLAWLADHYNRKWVILAGVLVWSAATFGSGMAMGFVFLFFARMLVGVGEATLSPAGFSMLSDYFPKEKLPAAISVFTGTGFLGSGLALVIGGYLYAKLVEMGPTTLPFGTFQPWQMTFFAVALLSVPVFLFLLLIREPVRREGNVVLAAEDAPPALEIISFIKDNARVFLPLFFGFSCFAGAQFGIGAWAPSYFIRVHEWTQLEVGQFFGPVVMFGGVAGVIAGGFAAERMLGRGSKDATLRLPIMAVLCALPFAIAFPLVTSPWLALGLLALVLFFGTVPFGAGVSTFPLITPNRMRAQVIAVYLLIANLLGYSAGPLLVAWLTDNVFGSPDAINQSLALAPPATMLVGLALVILALKPYRIMIQKIETESL